MKSVKATANGRVNLIGEHTDYNDGWVLPTAIPQQTTVTLTPREDQMVIARTTLKNKPEVRYQLGEEKKSGAWADYLQGATSLLLADGYKLKGFEITIDSNVPTGSGLSSSAAFEVAVLKALREAFALDLSEVTIAKLGQRIENKFVGANVGIMDQMACAMAHFGEALYLDTKTLTSERIAIPLDKLDLVVINSGVEHRITDGGYNQRRAECESAAEKMKQPSLRDVTLAQIEACTDLSEVERRRAKHVVTENARVHEAVKAMRAGDFAKLGELFYASHLSMKDDYNVSVPEIDLLVELCRQDRAVYGARLTGGGFGGSIVAITHHGEGARVAASLTREYATRTDQTATTLVP